MHLKGLFTLNVIVNTATLAILFSLKTMESLHNVVATLFWSVATDFNENRIASVIAEFVAVLTLMLGVNGPFYPGMYV